MQASAWRSFNCIKLEQSMAIHRSNKFQQKWLTSCQSEELMECRCISLWCQLHVRQRWFLSECIHLSFDDCRSKMSAVCFPFPHFLISNFSFLISSFLLLEWPVYITGYATENIRKCYQPSLVPRPRPAFACSMVSFARGESLGTRLLLPKPMQWMAECLFVGLFFFHTPVRTPVAFHTAKNKWQFCLKLIDAYHNHLIPLYRIKQHWNLLPVCGAIRKRPW